MAVCLVGAVWGGVEAAPVDPQVVFVAHDVTPDGVRARAQPFRAYVDVSMQSAPDNASQLRIRPLWVQGRGSSARGSLALDHRDEGDRAAIDILERGFTLTLPRNDGGTVLQPADLAGWERRSGPSDARFLALLRVQALGLRPVALPATPQLGQRLTHRARGGDFASLDTHMRVRALTPEIVLLDVEFEGDGLSGHGRQAVRRQDGRPLETRLYLTSSDGQGTPETHRLYLVDMATEPVLDLEHAISQPQGVFNVTAERLAAPPFSARSDDPALFATDPIEAGTLAAWMQPDDGSDLDMALAFDVLAHSDGGRPHIALHADGRPAASTPRVGFLHVRDVQLLDAQGQPLPGANPTVTQPNFPVFNGMRLEETRVSFPFRLPLTVSTSTLQPLSRIRLTADIRVYRWDRAEPVPYRSQSTHTADTLIEWTSPYRATLRQTAPAAGRTQGTWTTVVPIDAAGREIASSQLFVGRASDAASDWRTLDAMPLLQLDPERAVDRTEIATYAPMAGLRLLHYRWRAERRALTIDDISMQPSENDPDFGAD
ncbi:hypothetical protein BEN78_04630 [Xanthomonas citri pv. mangiferaeindicae]|nr:hypothetical protein BEN78_04630 [Xanthomonas citri pv. mangiferaeindicae]